MTMTLDESASMIRRRPLLLGHRGLRRRGLLRITSQTPVENSLDALEYALSQGCDGFEFDVRYTRDGRNVLWHDPKFNGREIASTDYAGLIARDGNYLPSLEEVLQRFGDRAYLDIELKMAGREEAIVAALKGSPPQRGYMVSSFLPGALLQLHDIDSQIPLGYICERVALMDSWRELPIRVVLPRHDFVQPPFVEEVHQHGLQIMTWTVNSRRRMQQFANWGVDGLISDDPQLLFRTLGAGSNGA
jgi:glycerophosphoryl diester phosphodiesterase